MSDDLRAKVRDLMPALRSDLGDLVRIESVSADPARAADFARRIYRAYFAQGRDIADPSVVLAIASEAGVDAASLA
ncbi:MAG TPA: DsbA family protein, partial [Nocardioides sp.]|nr:DsbA family protein [Nocardioides sp.]